MAQQVPKVRNTSETYVKVAGPRELQIWVFQQSGLLKKDL